MQNMKCVCSVLHVLHVHVLGVCMHMSAASASVKEDT